MTIRKTTLHLSPELIERAPSLVRKVLENLPGLRGNLDALDLSRQDQESRRAFVMRNLRFRKSGLCMFPECPVRSVSRSHAISRAATLSHIAENGHVVAPAIWPDTGRAKVKRIGLGAASTFPGFCRKHELMFSTFEQAKCLRSAIDWGQQFFRIACWEMRSLDHALSAFEGLQTKYDERIDAQAKAFLRPLLQGTDCFEELHVGLRQMGHYQARLGATAEEMESFRSRFHDEIFAPLCLDIAHGGERMGAVVLHVNGIILPLCLAGSGLFFWAPENGDTFPVLALLQVLPTSTGTSVGMLAPSQQHSVLLRYLQQLIGHKGGLGTMLETWMLHGTHQWFLRPSFWTGLASQVRAAIEHEVSETRYDLAIQSDLGIFAGILGEAF